MANFEQLLFEDRAPVNDLKASKDGVFKILKTSSHGRGCDNCPSKKNWKRGVEPVMGRVRGKDIFIFAQSPGATENQKGKELIGRAGEWFWKEMARVGLERSDCDIQNVVRCYPVTWDTDTDSLVMREPSKEELHCCSVYTDKALEKSQAKVYLVLGKVAGKELLGKEFRKDRRIFWSNKLNAKVYCLDHPAYFIRGHAPSWKLKEFRATLEQAALAAVSDGSQYSFLAEQDYKGVTKAASAKKAFKIIKKYAQRGRITVDIEAGWLEKRDDEGKVISKKWVVSCVGFCWKPGHSRTFCVDHPRRDGWTPIVKDPAIRAIIVSYICQLIEDAEIRKALHHGSYDDPEMREFLEARLRGYDYDTNYAEYLVTPGKKSYGLEEIAFRKYPQFSGYKMIRYPEGFKTDEINFGKVKNPSPEQVVKLGMKQGKMNLCRMPWKKMVMYNGADCDVTKRIEMDTKKHVVMPLMRVYKDAAYTVDYMEKHGPRLDFEHLAALDTIFPPRREDLLRKIRQIVGDPEFNPNSNPQLLKFLYKKLKLPIVNAEEDPATGELKPNTRKETLQILAQKHEFPQLILDFRRVSKICSTYLKGFRISAELHKGHLQTKWWLTGTRTGRMSSGGGGQKGGAEDGIVNLQNVHGDQQLQNLIISSKNWRKVYKAWRKAHKVKVTYAKDGTVAKDEKGKPLIAVKLRAGYADWWKAFLNTRIFLAFDQAQVEIRVLAQASGDQRLIADIKKGDIHSRVGHRITGWAIEKIKHDKKTRTLTKNVHFGMVFGLRENGLYDFIKAKDPTIDKRYGGEKRARKEIAKLQRAYFEYYYKVKEYQVHQQEFAAEHGYVETLLGYRRPLDTRDRDDIEEGDESDLGTAYWGNVAINCLDFATEGLTQRGWVKGYELKPGDVLLTKNQTTGKLEWQSATDVKVYPEYTQPLVQFKSRSFNAASTLDHRWLVTRHGTSRCIETKDISGWGDDKIHRTGFYEGPSVSPYPDDIVRLVGWFLTDGHINRGKGYGSSGVTICQSQAGNPDKVRKIDSLFRRLETSCGLSYSTKEPENRKDEEVFWHFSARWGNWMRAYFPDRLLTPKFLAELPRHQLEVLLDTMLLGDGCGQDLDGFLKKEKDKVSFCAKTKKQIDAFQMLCMLCGKACNVTYRDMSMYKPQSLKMKNIPKMTGVWVANVLSRKYAQVTKAQKSIVPNKGVWCPVVPNTFFVARRHGQPFITGNTPIQGTAHQLMIIVMALMKRFPKRYKLLKDLVMEIHDAMVFSVKLKDMFTAATLGDTLMTKHVLKVVKKEFKIPWEVPLEVEPKAGYRLGTTVPFNKDTTIPEFLTEWGLHCHAAEMNLRNELSKVVPVSVQ
jgi:uracil-DNA glycosylase family 4